MDSLKCARCDSAASHVIRDLKGEPCYDDSFYCKSCCDIMARQMNSSCEYLGDDCKNPISIEVSNFNYDNWVPLTYCVEHQDDWFNLFAMAEKSTEGYTTRDCRHKIYSAVAANMFVMAEELRRQNIQKEVYSYPDSQVQLAMSLSMVTMIKLGIDPKKRGINYEHILCCLKHLSEEGVELGMSQTI